MHFFLSGLVKRYIGKTRKDFERDMIDLAIKNIFRQKTRTALTIIGILIGIGAVVALGSISEGIYSQITEEMQFMGGTIMVYTKESSGFMTGFAGSEITEEDAGALVVLAVILIIVSVAFFKPRRKGVDAFFEGMSNMGNQMAGIK